MQLKDNIHDKGLFQKWGKPFYNRSDKTDHCHANWAMNHRAKPEFNILIHECFLYKISFEEIDCMIQVPSLANPNKIKVLVNRPFLITRPWKINMRV